MPQISKIRIVNFNYNDGNRFIPDSELGDYLHALNPNRSLPRNKKGLKRLLNVDI